VCRAVLFAFLAQLGCGTLDEKPIDAAVDDATADAVDGGPCDTDSAVAMLSQTLGPVCFPCPSATPMSGAPCDPIGLECEYGTSDAYQCNTIATCQSSTGRTGRWSVGAPARGCPLVCGGPCPAKNPYNTHCSVTGPLFCDYGSLFCWCDTAHGEWVCDAVACRGARPRLGCPCTPDAGIGQACTSCEQPSGPACVDGRWRLLYQPPCK
jgi:hypothetical protein